MNYEVFALIPPDGHVIQIFTRCGKIDFSVGYCRQIIVFGKHAEFVSPFRRAANATMTVRWAERIHLGGMSIKDYSISFCPAEVWMARGDQPKTSF